MLNIKKTEINNDLFSLLKRQLRKEQLETSYSGADGLSAPLSDIVQWLDDQKARNYVSQKREGLNSLKEWRMDPDGYFSHIDKKFFRIVGMDVGSDHREVLTWSQPILDNVATGVIGLLVTRCGGKTCFLMQAKAEAGNRNMVQLAPTVQFTRENYADSAKLRRPFLFEEFREPGSGFVNVWENMQAEEGGRFYKAKNLHRILMLPEHGTLKAPPEFRWLTLGQLRFFLHMGNIVNSGARSILSCLI